MATKSRRHWPSHGEAGQVRIIGGQWRGRKLQFFGAEGLRPTGDRIRETLFNWLQPSIEGSRCLDLFAGSGALGFEAASRGAAEVVMVEYHPATVRQLQSQIALFDADNLSVRQGSALHYLNNLTAAVDLVFLDPPFHSDLLQLSLDAIKPDRMLRPNGRIYLEYPLRQPPSLPPGMDFIRQKKAGEAGYGLIAPDRG